MLPPVDADDAWQETFLSALRAYPDLDCEANHEAWLVTIAYRKAIDVHRARTRRATPIDPLPDRATTDADSAQLVDLREALSQLTDRQRAAVVLHHVAGLRFAEVARVTGSTPTASRKAASDGMAALRAALTSGGTDDRG